MEFRPDFVTELMILGHCLPQAQRRRVLDIAKRWQHTFSPTYPPVPLDWEEEDKDIEACPADIRHPTLPFYGDSMHTNGRIRSARSGGHEYEHITSAIAQAKADCRPPFDLYPHHRKESERQH